MKYNIGIALSGGGARGIAHLGVLDALHKHGIEPEVVAGTSMGAIVGCFYAAGLEPKKILEEIKKEKLSKFLSWSLPGDGFFDLEHIEELMTRYIGENDFKALKKPLFVSVSNLHSGKNEIISQGPLFDYVIASASIPIVFKPRIINKLSYVDGGMQNNLPVLAIRDICRHVIAVHVNHSGPLEKIAGMKEIAERCLRLVIESNIRDSVEACDILIQPENVKNFFTFDFRKADALYKTGFDACENMMPEIIEKLGAGQTKKQSGEGSDEENQSGKKKAGRIAKTIKNIGGKLSGKSKL
jgi:NTE family protein